MTVGLDIGGTKCAISAGENADGKIKILSREEFPTAGLSWQQVLEEFARRIEALTSPSPVPHSPLVRRSFSAGGFPIHLPFRRADLPCWRRNWRLFVQTRAE